MQDVRGDFIVWFCSAYQVSQEFGPNYWLPARLAPHGCSVRPSLLHVACLVKLTSCSCTLVVDTLRHASCTGWRRWRCRFLSASFYSSW